MEYIGGVTEETKKQYIVVKIGSEQYGIDISYIAENHKGADLAVLF